MATTTYNISEELRRQFNIPGARYRADHPTDPTFVLVDGPSGHGHRFSIIDSGYTCIDAAKHTHGVFIARWAIDATQAEMDAAGVKAETEALEAFAALRREAGSA